MAMIRLMILLAKHAGVHHWRAKVFAIVFQSSDRWPVHPGW
jgi:hypothetical protein